MRYALALERENIFISRQISDSEQNVTRLPDKFKVRYLGETERHSHPLQTQSQNLDFESLNFQFLAVQY